MAVQQGLRGSRHQLYSANRYEQRQCPITVQRNQSAIPIVIEEAEKAGYHIDKMTMAGGSAGHGRRMPKQWSVYTHLVQREQRLL